MPDEIPDGPQLPEEGTEVVAMTYESIEYDRPPTEVRGTITYRPSPFSSVPQCEVDGVQVDPSTVRVVSE